MAARRRKQKIGEAPGGVYRALPGEAPGGVYRALPGHWLPLSLGRWVRPNRESAGAEAPVDAEAPGQVEE